MHLQPPFARLEQKADVPRPPRGYGWAPQAADGGFGGKGAVHAMERPEERGGGEEEGGEGGEVVAHGDLGFLLKVEKLRVEREFLLLNGLASGWWT